MATNSAVTVVVAAVVLLAICIISCYLPARRATQGYPLVAMRAD